MRVLVAPDSFTETLSAPQAAAAIGHGWALHAPADELELCPLSDGGPGFLDVLVACLAPGGADLVPVTVPGPLGNDVPAAYLLLGPDPGGDDVPTAYLESSQACGLHLVPPDRRDPGRTSTAGVGVLLQAAVDAGARRVVVGLGGSGTNDGGAGMLAALGAGNLADSHVDLATGGAALVDLEPTALSGLAGVRERLSDVELVVATDVDVPLLGFKGASASFAARKGASAAQAQDLDRALGRFAAVALSAVDVPQRLVAEPGSGAAGGLGFGLLLLGARREAGAQTVLDAVGFADRLRRCDVVVTGEGCFDWQSLRGKVVAGVAHEALAVGTPVVVVAGQVQVGRREMLSLGVESAYAVAQTPQELDLAMADPTGTLSALARRVARTWSR